MEEKKKLQLVTGAVLSFFSTGIIYGADLAKTLDLTGSVSVAEGDAGCKGDKAGDTGCSTDTKEDQKMEDKNQPKAGKEEPQSNETSSKGD